MPKYRFAVRSKEGKLRTGTVTEASAEAAKERLTQAGFTIVTLTEESELVIHQSTPSAGGGPSTGHKTERAAILEFETTAWERFSEFLGRWVFRKEIAVVLFLCGFSVAAYKFVTAPKKVQDAEPEYLPYSVTVEIDSGAIEGESFVVVLPEIPLRLEQKVSEGKAVSSDFESLKRPTKIEVSLLNLHDEVVAKGEGSLSPRKEGVLAGTVALDPVKAKP